jgi:hypothetical protein
MEGQPGSLSRASCSSLLFPAEQGYPFTAPAATPLVICLRKIR